MRTVHARRTGMIRSVAGVAAALLVVAACGGDDGRRTPSVPTGEIGGSVSVVGSWTGAEQDSFLAMVAPWEEETGVTVEYTGSRDLQTQLTTGIASGNLPDVAGIPGPGLMKEWYDQGALQAAGLRRFRRLLRARPRPGFAELGQAEDGDADRRVHQGRCEGPDLLQHRELDRGAAGDLGRPDRRRPRAPSAATRSRGASALESGAASGWPGTDWLEDIILRQAGPEVYDAWVAGEQTWTSPEIKEAWETFGEVLDNSYGGSEYVVNTNFGRAANPMFEDPPGCLLHHQASFITDFFMNEAGATAEHFDFFPFPDIDDEFGGAVTGGGDLFGMFNDTPQARSLIAYLLTPEAQQIWVERGGFISGNNGVPLDAYPDETSRKSAEILQNAETFRFDGSDQLPGAMNDAFFQAIVDSPATRASSTRSSRSSTPSRRTPTASRPSARSVDRRSPCCRTSGQPAGSRRCSWSPPCRSRWSATSC